MKTILLLTIIGIIEALHCDKEYNQIESFYERGYDITCQGLTNNFTHLLQELEVTNEISLKMENCNLTEVSPNLFHNVEHIKHFYLENSTFSYKKSESVFKLLENLEDLKIISTKFEVTKNSLSNLKRLKELTLVKNELSFIEKGAFNDLKSLKELHITENHLKDLNNVPLCELKMLTTLNFSKNEIQDLGHNLYCQNIQRNSLIINNKPPPLNSSTIISFPSSLDLYEIDLSHNNIKDLSTSFAFLKSLRIVKLQGNKLNRLNNSHFTFLEYLENLRVDNNALTFIEGNVFKDKQFLELLDLSNNELFFLNMKDLKSVKYLNLANNRLQIDSILSININNTLEILILDNNNVTEMKPNTFKKYLNLKTLRLSGNKMELSSFCLNGLFSLRKLYIINNSIKKIPKEVFKDLLNLTLLDLSQNNLTILDHNETFSSLRQLEVLNLSRNSLTSLSYALVEPLKNLVVLDISYNKLRDIDYDVILTNLPLLSILDIKFNMLSCELLSKIIKYLQTRGVTYTVQDKIDLDKVNVGGIYCNNEKVTNKAVSEPISQKSVMFNVTLGLIVVLILVILCIVIFKVHVYLKRRKYRADEFELIDE